MKQLIGLVALLGFMLGGMERAIQAEENLLVTKDRAIEIGNRHLTKMKIDLHDLDVQVDEGSKRWNDFMSILRASPDRDTQRQFQQYERKLKGRSYWAIFYKPKHVPGRGFKGGGATVLVDSKTGRVLLAIRGE